MRKLWAFAAFLAAAAGAGLNAWASEAAQKTVFEMSPVIDDAVNESLGGKKVLAVFDIDNTLLTPPQLLGSNQWFADQWASLQKYCPDLGVAPCPTRMSQLLRFYDAVEEKSRQMTTEPSVAPGVGALQASGVKTIALTDRGGSIADATRRQLLENGIDFAKNGFGESLADFPAQSDPRGPTYQNGVMMTAGQNKGQWLMTLLRLTGFKPDLVVYADDNPRYVAVIVQACQNAGISVHAYRYGRMDEAVAKYNQGDDLKAVARSETRRFAADGDILSDGAASDVLPIPAIFEINELIYGVPDPSKS
jgi:hypothetical protein